MLAKLLLESPDLMLLDEPSNHLDIETTAWLENYLSRQPVAMVVVSHDRYFLDKVVTKIWELHEGKIEAYPGNYTQYWRLRTEKAKVLERQAERQAGEDRRPRGLHPQVRRGAAGQAGQRPREEARRRIERVETMREIVGPVMGFGEVERSGDIVIEARNLSKAYDKPLFQDLNVAVLRGQCVGVMGPNGSGKTTLIKTLIGREKADRGRGQARPQGPGRLPRPGARVALARDHRRPRRLARGRPRLGRGRRPRPARPVRPDRRDRLPDRRPALRRREGQGRAGPALRHRRPTCWSWTSRRTTSTSGRARPSSGRSASSRGPCWSSATTATSSTRSPTGCIVLGDGQARVIEGDYETYQRLAAAGEAEAAAAKARPGRRPGPDRRRRPPTATASAKKKFPYRKAADLEREIAEVEAELAELEDLLGQPATWRDPVKAVRTQERHVELKAAWRRSTSTGNSPSRRTGEPGGKRLIHASSFVTTFARHVGQAEVAALEAEGQLACGPGRAGGGSSPGGRGRGRGPRPGRSRTRRSAPRVRPGLMPPPAIHMVKASMWWLRPIVLADLAHRRAAELAAPDDQRVVEQAARASGRVIRAAHGLVDLAADRVEVARRGLAGAAVVVPVGVVELDEPHAALDQPAGEQAVVGERRLARLGAVEVRASPASRPRGRSAPGRWSASGRPSRRRRSAWRSRGRRSRRAARGSGRGSRRWPAAGGVR